MPDGHLLERTDELLYVLLGGITLFNYLYYRDPVRRDTALIFGSLAVIVIINWVTDLRSEWVNRVLLMGLLAQPYLLLRVGLHLHPIPRRVILYVQVGFLMFAIGIVRINLIAPESTPFIIAMGVYFISAEAIPTILFLRGAWRARGITRSRLRAIGLGAALFALAISMLVSLTLVSLSNNRLLTDTEQLWLSILATVSVLCFYIGFAPPRWLWRPFQVSELGWFLNDIGRMIITQPINDTIAYMAESCLQAVGGTEAAIATVHIETLEVNIQRPHSFVPLYIRNDDKRPIRIAWSIGEPAYLHGGQPMQDAPSLRTALGAQALYIVPICEIDESWLILLLGLRGSALFVQDDLFLLRLFAGQVSALIENKTLVEKLRTLNEQLEAKVTARTLALRRSDEELRQRIGQLTALNRELEAFSYSVSHDLRAPLRAINGFSQALSEDFGPELSTDAQEYLRRIRAASQRMGHQIDDMLMLSRVTRIEMTIETVNLSEISLQIIEELTMLEPQRMVKALIEPGLFTQADQNLVELLLQNLIHNAWKFTSRKEVAQIDVGTLGETDITVYYVKDNGAGFDPQYAEKLFTVFQRLHAAADFEGSGVGLATAQRIVHRHGGRIWAEGKPNDGATFYFTLSPEDT
jgi:signal transduction histidine kinase